METRTTSRMMHEGRRQPGPGDEMLIFATHRLWDVLPPLETYTDKSLAGVRRWALGRPSQVQVGEAAGPRCTGPGF